MIGDLLEGRTKDGRPVLIVNFLNRTPLPIAICIHPDGTMKAYSIDDLSVDWHFDADKGWQRDFEAPAAPET